MTRTSQLAVCIGTQVVFADVLYYIIPGEEETYTSPGYPAECELLDVQRDGTSIMYLMTSKEIRAVEEEIEACYEEED